MLKQTLLKATEAGAAVLKQFFNGEFKVSNKEGINNLVTEADHAAERSIFKVIRESYPDHYLLSEEAGEIVQDSSYKWIIDPIDGTVNFANNIPICAVSIALEHEGKMILGAVYNPIMNEFFFHNYDRYDVSIKFTDLSFDPDVAKYFPSGENAILYIQSIK